MAKFPTKQEEVEIVEIIETCISNNKLAHRVLFQNGSIEWFTEKEFHEKFEPVEEKPKMMICPKQECSLHNGNCACSIPHIYTVGCKQDGCAFPPCVPYEEKKEEDKNCATCGDICSDGKGIASRVKSNCQYWKPKKQEPNVSELERLRYAIDDKNAGWLKGNTNRQLLTRVIDYLIKKEKEIK